MIQLSNYFEQKVLPDGKDYLVYKHHPQEEIILKNLERSIYEKQLRPIPKKFCLRKMKIPNPSAKSTGDFPSQVAIDQFKRQTPNINMHVKRKTSVNNLSLPDSRKTLQTSSSETMIRKHTNKFQNISALPSVNLIQNAKDDQNPHSEVPVKQPPMFPKIGGTGPSKKSSSPTRQRKEDEKQASPNEDINSPSLNLEAKNSWRKPSQIDEINSNTVVIEEGLTQTDTSDPKTRFKPPLPQLTRPEKFEEVIRGQGKDSPDRKRKTVQASADVESADEEIAEVEKKAVSPVTSTPTSRNASPKKQLQISTNLNKAPNQNRSNSRNTTNDPQDKNNLLPEPTRTMSPQVSPDENIHPNPKPSSFFFLQKGFSNAHFNFLTTEKKENTNELSFEMEYPPQELQQQEVQNVNVVNNINEEEPQPQQPLQQQTHDQNGDMTTKENFENFVNKMHANQNPKIEAKKTDYNQKRSSGSKRSANSNKRAVPNNKKKDQQQSVPEGILDGSLGNGDRSFPAKKPHFSHVFQAMNLKHKEKVTSINENEVLAQRQQQQQFLQQQIQAQQQQLQELQNYKQMQQDPPNTQNHEKQKQGNHSLTAAAAANVEKKTGLPISKQLLTVLDAIPKTWDNTPSNFKEKQKWFKELDKLSPEQLLMIKTEVPLDLQPTIDYIFTKKRMFQNNYTDFKPTGNRITPFRFFTSYKLTVEYYLKNKAIFDSIIKRQDFTTKKQQEDNVPKQPKNPNEQKKVSKQLLTLETDKNEQNANVSHSFGYLNHIIDENNLHHQQNQFSGHYQNGELLKKLNSRSRQNLIEASNSNSSVNINQNLNSNDKNVESNFLNMNMNVDVNSISNEVLSNYASQDYEQNKGEDEPKRNNSANSEFRENVSNPGNETEN